MQYASFFLIFYEKYYIIFIERRRKRKYDFRRVVVVKGDYKGRVGKADFSNAHKKGNVMLYIVEGEYPYRVCLNKEDVQELG